MLSLTILLICFIIYCFFCLIKATKRNPEPYELFAAIIYFVVFIIYIFSSSSYSADYHVAIDPFNGKAYSPFYGESDLTMWVYFLLFHGSLVLLWKKGIKLPPLAFVCAFSILLIGVVINVFIILQFSEHNTFSLNGVPGDRTEWNMMLFPIAGIFISIDLMVHLIVDRIKKSHEIVYKNGFLNSLNGFLANPKFQPLWAILFLFPIFCIITLILVLLGQEPDSLVKAFTETTTWRFSQKMHPPPVDHTGHYLCTVAAKGSPELVKPIHVGRRYGRSIIVNRQLKVANAFEEMIQVAWPRFHKSIRYVYDEYGYNLSLKISNEKNSNLTYILMKPLEWFFLFCLYLFWEKPEKLIDKQYR